MFTHKKVVNIYIFYELNLWLFTVGKDFALENSLFGAVKLTIDADPDIYIYIYIFLAIVLDLMLTDYFPSRLIVGLAKMLQYLVPI